MDYQEMNTGSPILMLPSQSGAICAPNKGADPYLASLSLNTLVLVSNMI